MLRKITALSFASLVFSSFFILGLFFFFSNSTAGPSIVYRVKTAEQATLVSGHIIQNTTWQLSSSPYVVNESIVVETGVFLTIEPGVTVKFDNGTGLVVDGSLIAQGNSTQIITFTANSTETTVGYWGGLDFRRVSTLAFDYATVEFADVGLSADTWPPKSLDVSNLCVRQCRVGLDYIETIRNSTVTNCTWGISRPAYVEGCVVSNCTDGICGSWMIPPPGTGFQMEISNSVISNNSANGIVASASGSGKINIHNNDISQNGINGIRCDDSPRVEIHYNNILDNKEYAFRINGYTSPDGVNATCNWWGTPNLTEIAKIVYDYYDDPILGKLNFSPCLNSTEAIVTVSSRGIPADESVSVKRDDGTEIGMVSDEQPLQLAFYSGCAEQRMGGLNLTMDDRKVSVSNMNSSYKFANWTSQTAQGTTNAISLVVISNDSITIEYKPQYLTNFTFMDYSGNEILQLEPTQFDCVAPDGNTETFISFLNQWIDNGTWSTAQIIWQGNNVKPLGDQTYDALPGGTWNVRCRIYTIDFTDAFKDNRGNVLNTQPSSFTLLFPNGTISEQLPLGQYLIQNGSTSFHTVIWEGTDVLPNSPAIFDTTEGNPVLNCSIYLLSIRPAFFDNTGIYSLEPSSWTIEFPNGTIHTVDSNVTYNQTQGGAYSIVSVIWKDHEVVPQNAPNMFLTSDNEWIPLVYCQLPTQISVSTSSFTSYMGFKVEIQGNITCNEVGIAGASIRLSYSSTGGISWNDITLVNSDVDGTFSVEWLPAATGNFLIRVLWTGNSTFPQTTSTVSLAVQPYENQYVFAVESNSTISDLTFDTASRRLSFSVSGENGTRGYTRVTIAKSLITDASKLKVRIDGTAYNYTPTETNDSWVLLFTYDHSIHGVEVDLTESFVPEFSSIIFLLLFAITALAAVISHKHAAKTAAKNS